MFRTILLSLALTSSALAASPKKSVQPARIAKDELVYALKSEGSAVTFLATTRPKIININGNGSAPRGEVTVKDTTISGEIEFDAASFKTGMDRRDEHLRGYLETEKHPTAKLVFKDFAIPGKILADQKAEIKEAPFSATLILHGERKDITGKMDLVRSANEIKGESRFTVVLSDYKIEQPSFAGVSVNQEIQVKVVFNGQLTPRAVKTAEAEKN